MAGQNSIMNGNAEIEDHLNCGEYADATQTLTLLPIAIITKISLKEVSEPFILLFFNN